MAVAGLEQFEPNVDRPADFTRFWAMTVVELRAVAPDVSVVAAETLADGLRLQRLEFVSLGGARLRGYLLRPPAGGPIARPLIVHAHGYNDRYRVMFDWARRGFSVFGFDARGFGRSAAAAELSKAGYVLTGVESPQTSILRGAVADFLQALSAAHTLLEVPPSSISFYGFSFGGALALMAAGLSREPDFVVLGQPTFGWNDERHRLALAGSALQVHAYLTSFPRSRDTVTSTLRLFDTLYFAPLVKAQVLLGVGLDDDVVPSRTVLAVANRFRCQVEVRLLPVSHSVDPRESLWSRFDEEWLGYLADGWPDDFGAGRRQVRALVA